MTMPPRLSVIGDLERPDHCHLTSTHRCYFWGEYTSHEHTNGQRWRYSPTNQLIGNFKKKMDRIGQTDWHYKLEAIDRIAHAFSGMWRWHDLQARRPALIPMPPSRARTDPLYDPRMLDVLSLIAHNVKLPLDIRDCLGFDGSIEASHEADYRPSPGDLYECLSIDTVASRSDCPPGIIFLFDDVLTTGGHFVAAAKRLTEAFPGIEIIGNFVARRRFPNPFADCV